MASENIVSPSFSGILEPNMEVKKFPDGDSYVRVPNARACAGKDVTVFHRLYPSQDSSLIQAVLIAEALKGAKSIRLVAPYLPYSRQDKLWLEGEVKSAECVVKLLADAGYSGITTLDCHFLKKEGEFDVGGLKIRNVSMASRLIAHARKSCPDLEVASPDAGANYMSGGVGMKKVRGDYGKGNIVYRDIEKMEINFDVKSKNVLIIDDMISTGSTMVKAVENLRKNGASRVILAATHGFFLGDSLQRLKSISGGVFVSNTIASPASEVDFMEALGGVV
jgi:ribose-phosphate pyrophosphokinase